jgi:mannitol operon repressor
MKMEPEVKTLNDFLNEFHRESDRGSVLIAASLLDERLKEIIENFLAECNITHDLLNGPNAPLASFYSRISIAYALGLIQENEYEEINIIRKIRNEFGHKWKDVNFGTDKISKLCLKLPWLGPEENELGSSPRTRFDFVVVILLADLLWRARLVKKEKRKIKHWPNKTRTV